MSRIVLSVLLLITLAGCQEDTPKGESPPDAGMADAAPKKYQIFCDVSGPLIDNYCLWFVTCGFEPSLTLQECTTFYDNFISWRCEVPVTQTDEHIDKCLDSFDSLECGRENFPAECEDVFFI